MIGRVAPTGIKPAPPSREQLKHADDDAWRAYHDVCWNVEATEEDRGRTFAKALETLSALLRFDQDLRKAT